MRTRTLKTVGIVTLLAVSAMARADVAATRPSDSPDAAAVRAQLVDWSKQAGQMSLQELRKVCYTENEREAVYADFTSHEVWEESKTQSAVREKWGAGAEAKFAHIVGTDTQEDDLAAEITVDGDHATVTWTAKEIPASALIKVDGHWLIDMHMMFTQWLKDSPTMETDRHPTGKLMKQAREGIAGGKFDDADAFIADFKNKWENGN